MPRNRQRRPSCHRVDVLAGRDASALAVVPSRTDAMPTPEQLDSILCCQLLVAWAGEKIDEDEPRLGWWDTDMYSEFGGHDLFRRLCPRTTKWAALEIAREAARRTDAAARKRDARRVLSLFHLGFDLDEALADRLAFHKRSGKSPEEVFPEFAALTSEWDQAAFEKWASQGERPNLTKEPAGRRLTSPPAEDPAELSRQFVRALVPIADEYPCPHLRSGS